MPAGPEPADHLEGGKEPRRDRRGLLLAVLAVAALAATGGWVADRAHQTSLDRQAAQRVAIGVIDDEGAAEADVLTALDLVNDGPDTVQVLTARFDLAGVPSVSVGTRLAPGERTSVELADDRPCTPALITAPPRAVKLRLVTTRGETITWRAPVSAHRAELMTEYARFRCGQKHPADALRVELVTVTPATDGLLLSLALTNTSTLPLTMVALTGPPGVLLDAGQGSVALPRETTPGVVPVPTMLPVRLRVSACSIPRRPTIQLLAQVRSPYETGTSLVELPAGGATDLLTHLQALCREG